MSFLFCQMSRFRIFCSFVITLCAVLFGCVYLEWDYIIQGYVYGAWPHWRQLVLEPWHTLLYVGPKFALGGCVLYWLFAMVFNTKMTMRSRVLHYGLAVIYTVSLIMIVVMMKRWTDVSCPWSHINYGGHMRPDTWLYHGSVGEYFECFPAGHATTGFMMLSWVLCTDKRYHMRIIITGLLWGMVLGGYQTLRGAHYLSHTLVTSWIAMVLLYVCCQVQITWNILPQK